MNGKVSQMTVDELRQLVNELVEVKLATLFRDAEDDLEFTDELKEILARQTEQIKNGERGEAMEDVIARLGLD